MQCGTTDGIPGALSNDPEVDQSVDNSNMVDSDTIAQQVTHRVNRSAAFVEKHLHRKENLPIHAITGDERDGIVAAVAVQIAKRNEVNKGETSKRRISRMPSLWRVRPIGESDLSDAGDVVHSITQTLRRKLRRTGAPVEYDEYAGQICDYERMQGSGFCVP